jgi:hypothetical protein
MHKATMLAMDHPEVLCDWLSEQTEPDKFALTSLANLFESWGAWSEGQRPKCSRKMFSMALKRHGFERLHTASGSAFEGLRLKGIYRLHG